MGSVDELPHVEVTSRAQWRAWLAEHHEDAPGVWLVVYKKHCGDRHLSWPDIVQEAICFGWIDSRTRRVDEDRTKLLLTPRKPGSTWSATNKRHVAELEGSGRIAPAGQRAIDAARVDGSWSFLDDIEALIEPDDLSRALDQRPGARPGWEAARKSERKRALYWIKTAKRAKTRADRIDKVVSRVSEGGSPV